MVEFKCEKCSKTFDHESKLSQHVNDKHSRKPVEKLKIEDHVKEIPKHEAHHKPKVKISSGLITAVLVIVIIGAGGYAAYDYFSDSSGDSPSESSILSAPMGPLGSTHIHADFGVFMDGEEITPLGPQYFVKNRFVHVESGAGAGTVIHMHATNVPLSLFFRSVGMNFNSECFRLDNGKEFCNEGNNTLRMFVRHTDGEWEQSRKFHTYVFETDDQILITYGNVAGEELIRQQNSVTRLSAATNSGRQMDLDKIPA